jgi:predicted membrane channel-forming protein YqfA (hemolysin III family)
MCCGFNSFRFNPNNDKRMSMDSDEQYTERQETKNPERLSGIVFTVGIIVSILLLLYFIA